MNAGSAFFPPPRSHLRSSLTPVVSHERRSGGSRLVDEVLLRLQAVAEQQHSVVSVDQMLDCDANHMWIKRRREDGIIVRIGPSVYRMGGVPETFRNRAMAAVLSSRAPALVSHRGAAHLLGFERVVEPRSVDITVPRHRRPRSRAGVRVHESLAFDLAEPTVADGIPVTGVARTILDCAPSEQKPIRL